VTIYDDTEKIPSQLNLLKTQHNDDSDDNDDKKAHLLGSGEEPPEGVACGFFIPEPIPEQKEKREKVVL
jgi:hypothetical protein